MVINEKRSFGLDMLYQNLSFVILTLGILSFNPVQLGMQFLEKVPSKFECRIDNQWQACTKSHICDTYYPNEVREGVSYRSVKTDPNYLNNWVDKLGMLCESQSNIGFLGSSYYIGIVLAMLVIPALSDCYGRKTVFIATMILQIFSQYGLMVSQNLHEATFFMILAGACWPGKRIAGLNYQLEFIPESKQPNYIMYFSFFDYPSLLLISMLYQYFSPDWYPQ